ncbi:hypothetical protein GQ53DRAFT_717254 [Thozetella sp. PMI_491]|nr:hypothetical protein GQ53DRAFT_717254 [Thozetella sp. PMI_491]
MEELKTRPHLVHTPKRWYWTARALQGIRFSKTAWAFVERETTETASQVWVDLTTTRWWAVTGWLLYVCWLSSLVTALAFFVALTSISGGWITSACSPDGTFRLSPSGSDAWGLDGFFQVTVAFGTFNFTQAKVIDIAWEVLVGRGGQIILAWFSWKVFSTYVAASMQVKPVTLETFRTIFFGEDPNLMGTARLFRDFWARRRLVSTAAMAFMLCSMVFVAIFPTIASAPTGYTTSTKAFVPNADKALIPYSDFSPVIYIIHDGSRINLTDEYPVIRSKFCKKLLSHLSRYGFYGRSNRSTVYNGVTLPAPALNISAAYLPPSSRDYGWNWTDSDTSMQPFSHPSDTTVLLAASNQTYTMRYVIENGVCAPQDSYTWGFSAIQLAILISLLFCWSGGLAILWLKAHLTIELRGGLEVPGPYKASLIFASALRREAMGEEKDVDGFTETELHILVEKYRKGGAVSLEPSAPPATYSFWRLAMREKWWILAWIVVAVCSTMAMTTESPRDLWGRRMISTDATKFFAYWGLCIFISITVAMFLGRKLRTRLLYVALGVFISMVVLLTI